MMIIHRRTYIKSFKHFRFIIFIYSKILLINIFLDEETNVKEEPSSPIEEENLSTQIDHTLIDALSASREKFPTSINNCII